MAKITWVFQDEQGTNLNRYRATNVETGEEVVFDLNRGGSISIVGTPLNANTLNQLISSINALYDDYLSKDGGVMNGNIDMNSESIKNVFELGSERVSAKRIDGGGEGRKFLYNSTTKKWYYTNASVLSNVSELEEVASKSDLKYRGGTLTTLLDTPTAISTGDLNVGSHVSKQISVGVLNVGDILRVYVGGNNNYYSHHNGGVFEIEIIGYTNTSSPTNPSGYCGKGGLIVPFDANGTQSFIISGSVYTNENLVVEVYALTTRETQAPVSTTEVYVHKIEKVSFS